MLPTCITCSLHPPTPLPCSFWGVFFVGYISRPAGAVLFGHLGDTKGRSLCLLISVLVMGVPTVSTAGAAFCAMYVGSGHNERHSVQELEVACLSR